MALLSIHHRVLISIFITFLVATKAHASVNFNTCLKQIRNGTWGPIGGTDNRGNPISNISKATGITYDLCAKACGSGSERFSWDTFSEQFGSWLLPWLALISQLPFGTHSIWRNFLSMMLTVGSPALAGFSLAITVLNNRWVARRFSTIQSPNSRNAVKVLSSFQQALLVVTKDTGLLTSLVSLPENVNWWNDLLLSLDYTHTWTISAGASVAWVIVAYAFTVIDSLHGDITEAISAHGQGIGSIWFWLLPVVTGWLQTSPKCDSERLYRAMRRANARAYIVTDISEPRLADGLPDAEHAISLATRKWCDAVRYDELCTAPIYNYARFLSWSKSVEEVACTFEVALAHANDKSESETCSASEHHVEETSVIHISRWAPGVFSRFFVASFVALMLQWGTTGGALIIHLHTPTYGIGCRTGSYLLYGSVGTISWILLMLSTFLCHYSTTITRYSGITRIARRLSIVLRWLGQAFAFCNAIWIILACVFQFGNVYDRCWCNSSVIGLGAKAYHVMEITRDEVPPMRTWWIIGVTIAAGSASLYALCINLFINPQLPQEVNADFAAEHSR